MGFAGAYRRMFLRVKNNEMKWTHWLFMMVNLLGILGFGSLAANVHPLFGILAVVCAILGLPLLFVAHGETP